RSTGKTLYVLDEPTTGLHFDDIRKLLDVLHGFVNGGNTVLVIEHNLDVVKTADWIIDLGPEGGHEGGEVVATGTPEDIAANEHSHTGNALKPVLSRLATLRRSVKPQRISDASLTKRASRITHLDVQGASEHNLKHIDV